MTEITSGAPNVRFGEYLVERPKSGEIFEFNSSENRKIEIYLAKHHLGFSQQEDLLILNVFGGTNMLFRV